MFKSLMGGGRSSSSDGRSTTSSKNSRRKTDSSKSTSRRKSSRGDDRDRGLGDLAAYSSSGSRSRGYASSAADESVASTYVTAEPESSEYYGRSIIERAPQPRDNERDSMSSRRRDRDRSPSREREKRKSRRGTEHTVTADEDVNRQRDRPERRRAQSGDPFGPPVPTTMPSSSSPSAQFAADIAAPGFSQFPMQYDNAMPPASLPSPNDATPAPYDPHVHQQFPGQFPSHVAEPYRPPNPAGAAADYYGDQGQSVVEQPGVRPNLPPIIPNSQAHLMPASPSANPPPEPSSMGQLGAAAAYYADEAETSASQGKPPSASSANPPKPSKTSKPGRPSLSGAIPAAAAGAVAYGVGTSMMSQGQSESSSAAAPQLSTSYSPPTMTSTSKPPNSYGIGTGIGAAAAGVAAGYMMGHHHSSSSPAHSSQYTYQNYEQSSPAGPPSYGYTPYGNGGHPAGPGALAVQHRPRGPLRKFVDFWRDPYGVGRFEDYTETIGVCRYCFEPGTSSLDAPRRHQYHSRRHSADRYSSGSSSRVNKNGRYMSSEDDSRRRKNSKKSSSASSWLPGVLAGYAAKSAFSGKEFEDSYSVRPARDRSSYDGEPITYTSRGAVRRSARSSSGDYVCPEHSGQARSRSRSSSRSGRHSFLKEAALGAAVGSSAMAVSKSRERTRGASPSRAERRNVSSSETSLLDVSRSEINSVGGGGGGLGSFFTASSENRQKSRNKKGKGFFSFHSSSSSSLDADLAFGSGFTKKSKPSKLKKKRKGKKSEDVDAALLGLGATATALVASHHGRSRSTGELLAAKDSRSRHSTYVSSATNDDDEWVDAHPEDQSSSSVNSALAFGGSSADSGSDSSISGWGWGWAKKKKKKDKRSSTTDDALAAGAGVLSGAALAAAARHRNSRGSSSVGSLQHVVPVPTSDRSRFDVARISPSVLSGGQPPIVRPGPIPLQQPQPVTPVSQAVYTTQGGLPGSIPAYSAPPVAPIFANDYEQYDPRFPESRSDQPYFEHRDMAFEPRPPRRSDSSPVLPSQESPVSTLTRRSTTMDQASVQFNLTEEQAERERRLNRQDKKRRDDFRDDSVQLIDQEELERRDSERRSRRRRDRDSDTFQSDPDQGQSSSSWIGPVAAGAIGAVAASTVFPLRTEEEEASEASQRRREKREKRRAERRRASETDTEPSIVSSFDGAQPPDINVTYSTSQESREKPTSGKTGRPAPVYEDYAEFFAPEELRHSPDDHAQRQDSSSRAKIVEIEPARDRFEREALEYPREQQDHLPWPVPRLNIIEPTPPQSLTGSVRDTSSPIAPVDTSYDSRPRQRPTNGSPQVSWGEHETHEYEVPSSSELDPLERDSPLPEDTDDKDGRPTSGSGQVSPKNTSDKTDYGADIEFAAAVAAATEAAGFNPSLVTDDPVYHTRTSPPGSEDEGTYTASLQRKERHEFLEDEVENTEPETSKEVQPSTEKQGVENVTDQPNGKHDRPSSPDKDVFSMPGEFDSGNAQDMRQSHHDSWSVVSAPEASTKSKKSRRSGDDIEDARTTASSPPPTDAGVGEGKKKRRKRRSKRDSDTFSVDEDTRSAATAVDDMEDFKSRRQQKEEQRRHRYEEIVESGNRPDYEKDARPSSDYNDDDNQPFLGERPEILAATERDESGASGLSEAAITAAITAAGVEVGDTVLEHEEAQVASAASSKTTKDQERSPIPRRSSTERSSTESPTAVPLHFRRPATSPGLHRSTIPGSPDTASPGSPKQPRHRRLNSTEFRNSREIRPLWLVERHGAAKTDPEFEEPLPSLPSSRSTSVEDLRSLHDNDGDDDGVRIWETVDLSQSLMARRQPTGLAISTARANEDARDIDHDLLHSQQATPTAESFGEEAAAAAAPVSTAKKEKLNYEFHSPSELLQDPSMYAELPSSPTLETLPPTLETLPSAEGSMVGVGGKDSTAGERSAKQQERGLDDEQHPPVSPSQLELESDHQDSKTPSSTSEFAKGAGFAGIVDAAVVAAVKNIDMQPATSSPDSSSCPGDKEISERALLPDDGGESAISNMAPPITEPTQSAVDYSLSSVHGAKTQGFADIVDAAVKAETSTSKSVQVPAGTKRGVAPDTTIEKDDSVKESVSRPATEAEEVKNLAPEATTATTQSSSSKKKKKKKGKKSQSVDLTSSEPASTAEQPPPTVEAFEPELHPVDSEPATTFSVQEDATPSLQTKPEILEAPKELEVEPEPVPAENEETTTIAEPEPLHESTQPASTELEEQQPEEPAALSKKAKREKKKQKKKARDISAAETSEQTATDVEPMQSTDEVTAPKDLDGQQKDVLSAPVGQTETSLPAPGGGSVVQQSRGLSQHDELVSPSAREESLPAEDMIKLTDQPLLPKVSPFEAQLDVTELPSMETELHSPTAEHANPLTQNDTTVSASDSAGAADSCSVEPEDEDDFHEAFEEQPEEEREPAPEPSAEVSGEAALSGTQETKAENDWEVQQPKKKGKKNRKSVTFDDTDAPFEPTPAPEPQLEPATEELKHEHSTESEPAAREAQQDEPHGEPSEPTEESSRDASEQTVAAAETAETQLEPEPEPEVPMTAAQRKKAKKKEKKKNKQSLSSIPDGETPALPEPTEVSVPTPTVEADPVDSAQHVPSRDEEAPMALSQEVIKQEQPIETKQPKEEEPVSSPNPEASAETTEVELSKNEPEASTVDPQVEEPPTEPGIPMTASEKKRAKKAKKKQQQQQSITSIPDDVLVAEAASPADSKTVDTTKCMPSATEAETSALADAQAVDMDKDLSAPDADAPSVDQAAETSNDLIPSEKDRVPADVASEEQKEVQLETEPQKADDTAPVPVTEVPHTPTETEDLLDETQAPSAEPEVPMTAAQKKKAKKEKKKQQKRLSTQLDEHPAPEIDASSTGDKGVEEDREPDPESKPKETQTQNALGLEKYAISDTPPVIDTVSETASKQVPVADEDTAPESAPTGDTAPAESDQVDVKNGPATTAEAESNSTPFPDDTTTDDKNLPEELVEDLILPGDEQTAEMATSMESAVATPEKTEKPQPASFSQSTKSKKKKEKGQWLSLEDEPQPPATTEEPTESVAENIDEEPAPNDASEPSDSAVGEQEPEKPSLAEGEPQDVTAEQPTTEDAHESDFQTAISKKKAKKDKTKRKSVSWEDEAVAAPAMDQKSEMESAATAADVELERQTDEGSPDEKSIETPADEIEMIEPSVDKEIVQPETHTGDTQELDLSSATESAPAAPIEASEDKEAKEPEVEQPSTVENQNQPDTATETAVESAQPPPVSDDSGPPTEPQEETALSAKKRRKLKKKEKKRAKSVDLSAEEPASDIPQEAQGSAEAELGSVPSTDTMTSDAPETEPPQPDDAAAIEAEAVQPQESAEKIVDDEQSASLEAQPEEPETKEPQLDTVEQDAFETKEPEGEVQATEPAAETEQISQETPEPNEEFFKEFFMSAKERRKANKKGKKRQSQGLETDTEAETTDLPSDLTTDPAQEFPLAETATFDSTAQDAEQAPPPSTAANCLETTGPTTAPSPAEDDGKEHQSHDMATHDAPVNDLASTDEFVSSQVEQPQLESLSSHVLLQPVLEREFDLEEVGAEAKGDAQQLEDLAAATHQLEASSLVEKSAGDANAEKSVELEKQDAFESSVVKEEIDAEAISGLFAQDAAQEGEIWQPTLSKKQKKKEQKKKQKQQDAETEEESPSAEPQQPPTPAETEKPETETITISELDGNAVPESEGTEFVEESAEQAKDPGDLPASQESGDAETTVESSAAEPQTAAPDTDEGFEMTSSSKKKSKKEKSEKRRQSLLSQQPETERSSEEPPATEETPAIEEAGVSAHDAENAESSTPRADQQDGTVAESSDAAVQSIEPVDDAPVDVVEPSAVEAQQEFLDELTKELPSLESRSKEIATGEDQTPGTAAETPLAEPPAEETAEDPTVEPEEEWPTVSRKKSKKNKKKAVVAAAAEAAEEAKPMHIQATVEDPSTTADKSLDATEQRVPDRTEPQEPAQLSTRDVTEAPAKTPEPADVPEPETQPEESVQEPLVAEPFTRKLSKKEKKKTKRQAKQESADLTASLFEAPAEADSAPETESVLVESDHFEQNMQEPSADDEPIAAEVSKEAVLEQESQDVDPAAKAVEASLETAQVDKQPEDISNDQAFVSLDPFDDASPPEHEAHDDFTERPDQSDNDETLRAVPVNQNEKDDETQARLRARSLEKQADLEVAGDLFEDRPREPETAAPLSRKLSKKEKRKAKIKSITEEVMAQDQPESDPAASVEPKEMDTPLQVSQTEPMAMDLEPTAQPEFAAEPAVVREPSPVAPEPAPETDEWTLSRKASKKKAKKAKTVSQAMDLEPSTENEANKEMSSTHLEHEEPVKAPEAETLVRTSKDANVEEDEWPTIDWDDSKAAEMEQPSEQLAETEPVTIAQDAEAIGEFDESAIPVALQEATKEPEEAVTEGTWSTPISKKDKKKAKKNKWKSQQAVLEEEPAPDPVSEKEIEQAAPPSASVPAPVPMNPEETSFEPPVKATTSRGSKIASLFPALERGGFKRPALGNPPQSPKDYAAEEIAADSEATIATDEANRTVDIPAHEQPTDAPRELEPGSTALQQDPYVKAPTTTTEDEWMNEPELTAHGQPTSHSPSPAPMESASKERSSVLFSSSPSMRTELDPTSPRHSLPSQREAAASKSPSGLHRTPSVIHGHHQHTPRTWSLEPVSGQEARTPSPPRSLFGGPVSPDHDTHSRPRTPLGPIAEQEPRDAEKATTAWRGTPRLEIKPEHVLPRPQTPVRNSTDNALSRETWPSPENGKGKQKQKQKQKGKGKRRQTMGDRDEPSDADAHKSSGRGDRQEATNNNPQPPLDLDLLPSSSSYDPVNDKGKRPLRNMTDVYEGWGETQSSPRSPSRPPSVRHRRSIQHLQDLESRLDQLISENRLLIAARDEAEDQLRNASVARRKSDQALNSRGADLRDKEAEVEQLKNSVDWLEKELSRMTQENEGLTISNAALTAAHAAEVQNVRESSTRKLEDLRTQHSQLSTQVDDRVHQEIEAALAQKDTELRRLREELEDARDKVKELQQQIAASVHDNALVFRDEDYFDAACQNLCGHVQQWVLRFSKHSDHRRCRLIGEIHDEKIADRFDNALLDGSDADSYLSDRVRRRDVFMSVVMTMVWEYIFTRYLFGMDREQRQKLKSLEKQLGEVGPRRAVHRWRATTLTLLSRRQPFASQRESDSEAVTLEIFGTLSQVLPPPSQVESQLLESLRKVLRVAVNLSLEMRTQLAEFIMLPPLQPEYDSNGDLARQVYFNASLMNERSGETTSNEDLEAQQAVVRIVLFPLVVKKGNDVGEGDDEVVVCPAQVLVARPGKDKVVRMMSGDRMSLDVHSVAPPSMMDISNMI